LRRTLVRSVLWAANANAKQKATQQQRFFNGVLPMPFWNFAVKNIQQSLRAKTY
jgi:hypothetical protein